MNLVKVAPHELKIGTPLPFAVYSATGKLLLTRGYCVRSESQRDRILTAGGFRDDAAPADRTEAPMPAPANLLISTAKHDASARESASPVTSIAGTLPKVIDAMQLSIVGHTHAPLQTDYVGSIAGQALLLTATTGHELFEPGVEVECKALRGRKVYMFRSTVIGRSELPVRLVYLAQPDTVRTHIVRKHVRVSTELAGRLIRNDCIAAGFDVTVVNVSLGGVALSATDVIVNVGEHFKLSLRLRADGKLHAVVLNCIARSLRHVDGAVLVGVEFSNRTPDITALLRAHLFEMATGSGAD
jgi:hypothetical protein